MNDRTVNLDMPFLMPSQAQKHVTHNEALLRLDAIVQLSIVDERTSPPSEPSPGSRYLVGADPAGAWSGHAGDIAIWQDGYWAFASPNPGWQAWFETGSALKVFDGETWQRTSLPDDAEVATLGISTSADATNRIAVSSPASLFSHAGGGHQIKINKAVQTDTATLLFQSGWIGHAEMGLAGNNDFSIKTSNGTDWKTGLAIDGRRSGDPPEPAGSTRPSQRRQFHTLGRPAKRRDRLRDQSGRLHSGGGRNGRRKRVDRPRERTLFHCTCGVRSHGGIRLRRHGFAQW